MTAVPSNMRDVGGAVRRFSRAGALGTLYKLTLRQHLHGRRWMVMVALFLLPVAIAILVRSTARDAPSIVLEFVLAFMLVPLALLPLIALLYASGMIQDEQEEQTITYLLVRPIPKWAMYVTKLLATWTTAILLTVVLTVLTYAAIYVRADMPAGEVATRCAKAVFVHSLAVVAYCALFGFVSLLTKRTLIVGIVYIAVVEGVCAYLPFGIRMATVIYYTRLIVVRLMDFVVTYPGGSPENIARGAWGFNVASDPQLLDHPSMRTCLIVLGSAILVCTVVAAWLCQRREFRVKTPESE